MINSVVYIELPTLNLNAAQGLLVKASSDQQQYQIY